MNEGTKTGIFWAVAVVMVGIALFVAWPQTPDDTVGVRIGKPLFEEFKDPLAAASLKIVTFDETLGQLDSFEVAKDRQTGVWSIPSRQGYPADATEQMQQAATALLDLKILDIKTDKAEEHDEYGVLEPKVDQLRVGDEGVGRLVSIKDGQGNNLASLIIGDAVRDNKTHRYVRIPNQDPVYEVELDDAPLTTQFRQWIEDDLLKLSSFDIAGTKIRNYSVSVAGTVGGGLAIDQDRSYEANLALDDSNQWTLEDLVVFDDQNTGRARTLEEGESLNAEKLNTLKNALDDLKIVDVRRKPEGMSADLKADKSLLDNVDAVRSLISRGFYPMQGQGGEPAEILATNGELIVDLKDGVEYVLRFGSIEGFKEADESETEDADGEQAEDEAGANRYLLVTTRVNESQIPPPEVKVVPQTLEELEEILNPTQAPAEEPAAGEIQENPNVEPEAAAEEAGDSTTEAAEEDAAEEEAVEEEAVEEVLSEEEAADGENAPVEEGSEANPDDAAGANIAADEAVALVAAVAQEEESGDGQEPAGDQEAAEAEPAEQEPAETDEATAEDAAGDDAAGDDAAGDDAAGDDAAGDDAAGDDAAGDDAAGDDAAGEIAAPENAPAADEQAELTAEEQQERLEAEQEKIKKENQRLRDAWKEKLEAAENRVRELNSRFADWYYIIPESTYNDLQINLDDLIIREGESPTTDNSAAPPATPSFLPPELGGN